MEVDQAVKRLSYLWGASCETYRVYLESKGWQNPKADAARQCSELANEGLMIKLIKPLHDKHGNYRGQNIFYRSIFSAPAPVIGFGAI